MILLLKSFKIWLTIAAEAITLLKNNDDILPLKRDKDLVVGPNANNMRCLNGAWTILGKVN